MKINVLIGIDMETDIGSWTPYYEGVVKGTTLVMECMSRTGINGTFFFTGDAAKKNPAVLKRVAESGYEIGAHSLYHETLGDSILPIPGVYPLLPHEVKPRLELNTKIIEDIISKKVVSFRCPRLFGSTYVVNALEELGYVADSSYPMFFYGERLLPYHPSKEDWTKEGEMNLVEIPCFADMSMKSKDRYGRDRDQWPKFRTESASSLMKHIDGFLEYVSDKHNEACLGFYFHPWEFIEMPKGLIHYGEGAVLPDSYITKNTGDYAVEQFELLIKKLQSIGAEFHTAHELAQLY